MTIHPLLSICIPTYNRGYILKEVLDKYVKDPEFDENIEIVISDNCSTDSTEEICREYAVQYDNIKYFRNQENVKDANFFIVLARATGEYLKLMNDWTYCIGSSLSFLKEKVRENLSVKKPLFFTDGLLFTKKKIEDVILCKNLDEYVQAVSTYVTSNNCFGVWREQWKFVSDKDKYTDLKLQQEDWSYQIIVNGNGCIIYNKKIFSVSQVKRKILSGYNWFQVHMDNYYTIMMPYVNEGMISSSTLKKDKHYLLEHFKEEMCYTFLYNFNKRWRYGTEGTTRLLKKYYSGDNYLIYYFMKLPFYYPYLFLKHVVKTILKIGA